MRAQAWLAALGLALYLGGGLPAVADSGLEPASEHGSVAGPAGPRLALQPCRFPQRFERCLFDCERQERNIERLEGCSIEVSRYRTSTCPERIVAVVRQCLTECNANFCPQFNP